MDQNVKQWLAIRKLERDISEHMGNFGYDGIQVTFLTHNLPKDIVAALDRMLDLMDKENKKDA